MTKLGPRVVNAILCGVVVFILGWVVSIWLLGWVWGLLAGWWPAALIASLSAWLLASVGRARDVREAAAPETPIKAPDAVSQAPSAE